MNATAALPPIAPPSWTVDAEEVTRTSRRMRLRRDGSVVVVELERCTAGRLAAAYPVGARDVELRVELGEGGPLSDALRDVTAAVRAADPGCRKVVYAADVERPGDGAAALAAGFRPVVEVDVPEPVELYVWEPAWVTRLDTELDEVPGS